MIQLLTQPSGTIFFANDKLEYKIGVDALADPDEIQRISYEVFVRDIGGGNIVKLMPAKSTVIKSLTDVIHIDASEIIRCGLGNAIPILDGSSTAIANPSFGKEFYIEYTETIRDTGTGDIVTDSYTSAIKTIYNVFLSPYQTKTRTANMMLSDKQVVTTFADAHDWVMCVGSYDINIIFYRRLGLPNVLVQYLDSNKMVPIGPAQFSLPTECYKYTVTFATGEVITYHIRNHIADYRERIDIYFWEPKGGWSSITFKSMDSEKVSRNIDEVRRAGIKPSTTQGIFESYGIRSIHSNSASEFEVSTEIQTTESNIEYLRSFANARAYRAAFRFSDNETFIGTLIPSETIVVSENRGFWNIRFRARYGLEL